MRGPDSCHPLHSSSSKVYRSAKLTSVLRLGLLRSR